MSIQIIVLDYMVYFYFFRRKENSMFLCRKYVYAFTKTVQANLLQIRTMTLYGIELPGVIFQIQKKSNAVSNSKFSENLINKKIDIIIPKNCNNVHHKLLRLHNVERRHKAEQTCAKGYYKDGETFHRTIAYLSSHDRPSIDLDRFTCISFHWKDGKLLKTFDSGKDAVNEEEYELNFLESSHPVFASEEFRPVYHSFDQTMTALRNMSMLDGVKTLNDTVPEVLSQNLSAHNTELNNPFIVVEGLDGTGKSTITKNLCTRLNAVKMATPPDSIRHIRKKFDHLPELCRRAYYSFSNYMAAKDVLDVIRTRPVVMDRYWHSTTAYAIAKEVAVGIEHHLPDEEDSLYAWPEDLLRPSAVLFLTTPEKHRDGRVNERDDVTTEEREISESERFRMRIMEVYRKIGYTKWVEVDTSGTQEESLEKAIKGLGDVGVEL
ncbi:uncharacterized protein LOC130656178 [Hydractinia symbiolongicarpus]|uniref:uncharacterized protein LOC130656178 n=1 Tax=Hydractinia symbiolongicarpus TaxID=13093 RepID=UPI0025516351|nr:uncharacterized protein LOC130656178 [Hydractinia symbiolongicarpus]